MDGDPRRDLVNFEYNEPHIRGPRRREIMCSLTQSIFDYSAVRQRFTGAVGEPHQNEHILARSTKNNFWSIIRVEEHVFVAAPFPRVQG